MLHTLKHRCCAKCDVKLKNGTNTTYDPLGIVSVICCDKFQLSSDWPDNS